MPSAILRHLPQKATKRLHNLVAPTYTQIQYKRQKICPLAPISCALPLPSWPETLPLCYCFRAAAVTGTMSRHLRINSFLIAVQKLPQRFSAQQAFVALFGWCSGPIPQRLNAYESRSCEIRGHSLLDGGGLFWGWQAVLGTVPN